MTLETEPALDTTTPTTHVPKQLGFGAKLWSLFIAPRTTFENVGKGHEWIVLWLIISAVALAGYYPIKDMVKANQIEQVEKQLANNPGVSAEQRQEYVDKMAENFDNPVWLLLTPVFILIALVCVAGILLFIANILLGGNATYLPMLNAYAWVGMIVIIETVVVVPLVMAKGSMDVSLGLGVLTNEDTGAFLKKVLSLFELFGLWKVWLSSVAVSALGKAPMGKSFVAVFAAWLVWVLIQGGFAMIGVNFGM